MPGLPGSSRSRAVGRYDLVVELAKSQLGPLWAAKANGGGGPELCMVRRMALPSGAGQTDRNALIAAARWSEEVTDDRVLSVLDTVEEERELAMVSRFVPGETLRSLLRLSNFKRQPIPSRVALRIILDTCRALAAAELRAVSSPLGPDFIYGGLLPDSVVVGTDGTTRLADVGLAAVWRRIPGASEHAEITAYSSPEQLSGASVDSSCDLFILGALLWEMLSGGKRLFVGSSHRAVAEKVCRHPIGPIAPGKPGESVPAIVDQLVSKLLERDPRRRLRNAGELIDTIETLDAADVALPVEVSDFLTTLAHSALTLRERVLDRALERPPRPAATPPPESPSSAAPKPAVAPGEAVPAASVAPERPALAPLGARPLPLPAQAKLGSRISAPEVVLPPPPFPQSGIKVPPPPVRPTPATKQDAESVRAADILRALAVEDAPASDELPTLPPGVPMEASVVVSEASAEEAPAAPSELLRTEAREQPPPQAPTRPADANERASDEAIGGLPARQSTWGQRRFPILLAAGAGGCALLIMGLVFALGSGGSTEPSQAAQGAPKTSHAKPNAPKAPVTPQQTAPKQELETEAKPEPATQAPPESANEEGQTSEPAPPPDPAPAVAAPAPRPAKPQRQASPPVRRSAPAKAAPSRLRAKRTYIPSGI